MNVSRRYNLVEVILALGVMAIGVVSIMALFPIGANASRDASMETYAANVAEEMLQFMKYRLKEGNTQSVIDNNWTSIVGNSSSGEITATRPSNDPDDDEQKKWNVDNVDDLDSTTKWDELSNALNNNSHILYRSSSDPNFYQLIGHHNPSSRALGYTDSGNPENDFATNVDFRAIAYMWKEQIVMDATQSGSDYKIPYAEGVRIILRVTWPAELPYSARQKADYALEIFKPYID